MENPNQVINALPDWQVSLLDHLAKRGSGHTPDKAFDVYYNGGIKWVSLADSYRLDKGFIYETDYEISELGIKKSSAVLHSAGTVLMSRDAGVGKSAVMGIDMAVSQHFITWTCKPGLLYNWFLYYWLQYKKEYFERQAVGSTIKTIGLPLFKKLTIKHPEYSEQKAIAELILTWDKVTDKISLLVAQKELRKKGLMQQLLTGKKRLPGFEGRWKEVRLGDICTIKKGVQLNKINLTNKGEYPAINGGIEPSGYTDKWNAPANSITISEGGNSCGFVNYIKTNFWSGGHCYTLQNLKNEIDQSFLFQILKFKEYSIMNLRVGSGLPNIQMNSLKDFLFSIPTLKEQIAIAQVLGIVNEDIQLLKGKQNFIKKQKEGLMQVLLTGKKKLKF